MGLQRWSGMAAVAVVASVATVGVTQFVGAAGTGGGTASSLVPIVPCRLADTRPAPDNVGPRATPLEAGETLVVQVTGTNGNCIIPAGATGIAANVTAVGGTAASFLTMWPADAERPVSANLNWTASSSPTPNQVTVGLSATGAVAAYNYAGSVHLVIDVVGYYAPTPAGATGPAGPAGPTGPAGATGGQGPAGSDATIKVVRWGQAISSPLTVSTVDPNRLVSGTSITLTKRSTVFGSATGAIGYANAASSGTVSVDLCYWQGISKPTFFTNQYTELWVEGFEQEITASSAVVLDPGTWSVSMCVLSESGTATFNSNDWVKGWVAAAPL